MKPHEEIKGLVTVTTGLSVKASIITQFVVPHFILYVIEEINTLKKIISKCSSIITLVCTLDFKD